MKKILLAAFVCAVSAVTISAQETTELTEAQKAQVEELVQERLDNEKFWKRNSGLRLGYTVSQDLKNENGGKLKSSFGANIAYVWNITLHKKPIFDRVKFGLEFGPNLNYVQFDENPEFLGLEKSGNSAVDEALDEIELGYHQADIGIKLGASVIVRPFTTQDFRVQGFFHVTPSASVLINDNDVCASFVPFLDYGIELSWKRIGLGIEMRQGSGKYKVMSDELAEEVGGTIDDAIEDATGGIYTGTDVTDDLKSSNEKFKLKTKAFRVYLVFKF